MNRQIKKSKWIRKLDTKKRQNAKRRKSTQRETWRELASVVRSNPLSMSVVLERKPNYMALPLAQWLSVCLCVCTEKVGLIRLTDSSHFSTALSTHLKTHTHTCMHINVRSRGNFSNSISLFETPIAIAAITVKGIQPPRTSPPHTHTLKGTELNLPS